MNVNFGLFPPLAQAVRSASGERLRGTEKTLEKKRALTGRALVDLELWLAHGPRAGGDHAAAAE
jgi:methylenetetrahydrofolate--tRNA-(uracil-5-)-methyltransferase